MSIKIVRLSRRAKAQYDGFIEMAAKDVVAAGIDPNSLSPEQVEVLENGSLRFSVDSPRLRCEFIVSPGEWSKVA